MLSSKTPTAVRLPTVCVMCISKLCYQQQHMYHHEVIYLNRLIIDLNNKHYWLVPKSDRINYILILSLIKSKKMELDWLEVKSSQTKYTLMPRKPWFPLAGPPVGQAIRVDGEQPEAYLDGYIWTIDIYSCETSLAENHPPATAINCREIKTYPAEIRALIYSRGLWFQNLFGIERALFDHKKMRKLRLKCPVML